MGRIAIWIALLAFAAAAPAADIEAGKAKVQSVCAACHGAAGVSVSDTIPNLAGQRAGYLETQLKALKDGSRKNPIMNAIAGQMSAEDIADVAAYLCGATRGARHGQVPVPAEPGEDRRDLSRGLQAARSPSTTRSTSRRPGRCATTSPTRRPLQAAKAGKTLPDGSYLFVEVHSAKLDDDKKPVTGSDGFFAADQLLFYTAMARDAGWGKDIPEMLRNEDWNYAVFTNAKQPRAANQAECLACHKPLDKVSYTFTLEQLKAAPKVR